jgi:hypothetical protein
MCGQLLLETIVQYVDEVAQCKGVLDVVGTGTTPSLGTLNTRLFQIRASVTLIHLKWRALCRGRGIALKPTGLAQLSDQHVV